MRSPEEALAAARAAAARESGSQAAQPELPLGSGETQRDSLRRLSGWAMIEPNEAEIYSTRRLGAPITALKRLLVRLLRQYLVQVSAQQSRFNANMVAHLLALEERVAELEEIARGQGRGTGPERPEGTAGR